MNRKAVILSIIFLLFISQVLIVLSNPLPRISNPIPSTQDEFPTGSLLPEDISTWMDSNRSIFLKTETINVTLDQGKADVQALYVLKNEADHQISLKITLPFSTQPSNVQLMVNGNNMSYYWIKVDEIEVPDTYPKFTSTHSLDDGEKMILFSLNFTSFEEKQILATYQRDYSIVDSRYDEKIVSEFRYIIGTSRWWKYPLESAHFEFWVLKDSFDKGAVVTTHGQEVSSRNIPSFFINSSTKDYVCLSVNYMNWMPSNNDYLVLYWEKARPFLRTRLGVISFYTAASILSVTAVIGSLWLPRRIDDHKFVKLVCRFLTLLFVLFSIFSLVILLLLLLLLLSGFPFSV